MALETYFESELHKFNWVRRYFARRRFEQGSAPLFYQPERLRALCKVTPIDALTDAINAALERPRSNYFVAFLETLGEERSFGGWDSYLYS
jgi:hypothetical protein